MNPIPCAVKGQDNVIVLCIDVAFVPMMTLASDKPMLIPTGICLVTVPEKDEAGKEIPGKVVSEFATIPLPNLQPLVAFGPQVAPVAEDAPIFIPEQGMDPNIEETPDPLLELLVNTDEQVVVSGEFEA